ncbi:hypothetical protein [Dactylosporangium sp. NPDC005555]|uniref:nucleotidyltransferase domain-containing protein n=1 Tax=Dactylosporangium sp. NPDC005555 TaxID=3154889 RepID=UPI0033A54D92
MPDLDAWDPWHPRVLTDRLAGLDVPWCVVAGWALDLFRRAGTRPHHDVEIAVPADTFDAVAARFDDCDFFTVHSGTVTPATADTLRTSHQTWAWDRAAGAWRFDVFREPHDGGTWICRREPRIRRPYSDIIHHTPDGIPFLAPEFVLLFKSKDPRPKDESDFRGILPLLSPDQRRRLDELLAMTAPTHPWRATT